jgi:hypothetical protein
MTMTGSKTAVDILVDQHREMKSLLERLTSRSEPDREQLFWEFVRLMAVHESAEELMVHPAARRIPGGSPVVDSRLREESEAKRDLAMLCGLGVHHPEFHERIQLLASAVITHAQAEEAEEFPALLRQNSPAALQRMAGAIRAAEAVAPTRPHPQIGESPFAHAVAGPVLAVFDRTRDAVLRWSQGNARPSTTALPSWHR